MPIDFFASECSERVESECFGLCDAAPPAEDPAYIDHNNESSWIAEVKNPGAIEVTFTAIDHCIEIRRPNGDLESRCDGLLTTTESIIFVELKDRAARHGWISDGLGQLIISVQKFKENHSVAAYSRKEGYVANKQRPYFNNSIATSSEKFKNETGGFIFKVSRIIEI